MSESAGFSTHALDGLARSIEELMMGMSADDATQLIGPDLSRMAARIPSEEQVTPGAVVRLALLTDALVVAQRAIRNDGDVTESEVRYVEPLAREALKYLGRFRPVYRESVDFESQGIRPFLEQHARDAQPFGGKCRSTAWLGLAICKRATELSRDDHFVESYRDVASRIIDDIFADARSGTPEQKAQVTGEIAALLPAPKKRSSRDPRESAYCAAGAAEVFHAVAHKNDVFAADPFDVEKIHADARDVFARLLARAAGAHFGRILLIKGESGSGKTHLMRAFRNVAHGEGLGFVGYMQMSTTASSYARYILANLIESWDRPYWGEAIPDTALACLSDAVARDTPVSLAERLKDEALPDADLHDVVNAAADALLALPAYAKLHVDLLRMMLYLQRREPALRSRVLKFLRCESLNAHERRLLGETASPLPGDESVAEMVTQLGNLVAATGNGALVLLVDQLEDVYEVDQVQKRFRRAIDALRHTTDHVPTSVVVVACLDDLYDELRKVLNKPVLDRLERDPEPVKLTAGRSPAEIEELIGRRLEHLFNSQDVRRRDDEPLYPFAHADIAARAHQRTRDVLDWCRAHQTASIRAGAIVVPDEATSILEVSRKSAPPPAQTLELEQAWNDFRAGGDLATIDAPEMPALLHWALGSLQLEGSLDLQPSLAVADGYIDAALGPDKLLIGVCDKTSRGGALGTQVDALVQASKARGARPIAVRSSEYPLPGATQIAKKLKNLLEKGGRRVVATDSEWRALHALREFCERNSANPNLGAWLRTERPLTGTNAIRGILDLDSADVPEPDRTSPDVSPPPAAQASPPAVSQPGGSRAPLPPTSFGFGTTRGLSPRPVLASAAEFVRHAAFLGSSGSGKTTLALTIIENLLAFGVPVLMLDRKGDLASYARPEFWENDSGELKRTLRDRVQVNVFTPGEPRGRSLLLPVVPSGLADLPANERGNSARHAATALGTMMGYRGTRTDETRLGILGKAIELVGQTIGTATPNIGHLVSVLDTEDPELVSMIGKLDTRHFRALVENLETLRLRYEHLLRDEGAVLSPELLFGLGGSRGGRTQLSIVSTKFLGDNAAIDFWVSRLLGELSRWASRSPCDSLQAVLFLDEADIYLPAQSKPATKEPMLDLLKRARSAGLGVFIATQSPGDLDYRCRDNIRTWFVGRVAEKTAVEKMKPLLSECRTNVSAKLAGAKVGEFFKLQDGEAVEFKASESLMRTAQISEDEITRLANR